MLREKENSLKGPTIRSDDLDKENIGLRGESRPASKKELDFYIKGPIQVLQGKACIVQKKKQILGIEGEVGARLMITFFFKKLTD